jgi:predicted negative regulator of RcsB-dependent stress response
VEEYRTEEEQLEALRRWWDENGRSTLTAIFLAVAATFGWQAWQTSQEQEQEQASDMYQSMLRVIGQGETAAEADTGAELAEQLKREYGGSTYARFAALHLAAMAVNRGDLAEAEAQLRWVLGKADKGSDTERVAQLRLARVMASAGNSDQALAILKEADPGPYGASYAVAEGDILLAAGRRDEARDAFQRAVGLAGAAETGLNLPALQQKLQSLTPVPSRTLEAAAGEVSRIVEASETVEVIPQTTGAIDEQGE